MGLKRIEILIAVQEGIAMLDAEAGKQYIDGTIDRDTLAPQRPIMLGSCQGVFRATDSDDRQRRQCLARGMKVCRMAKTAQHFKKREIGHFERRGTIIKQIGKTVDGHTFATVKKVNPDRGVGEDHLLLITGLIASAP